MLKTVWDVVQRLENVMKKRSIRIDTKPANWPFRDIVELGM